jgi:hypothetical protein
MAIKYIHYPRGGESANPRPNGQRRKEQKPMSDPNAVTLEADRDKSVTIIVNGRKKDVTAKELSFEEIVNLAFDNNPPVGPYIVITVTYSKGEDGKQGSLLPGNRVKVKAGMIFNVTATDKS